MIEKLARIPVEVEYASEFRYRDPMVTTDTLAVVITQSGETADTLAALREAREGRAQRSPSATSSAALTREADGRHLPARRPGDRRGVDQGVHLQSPRCICSRCTSAQVRGTLAAKQSRATHIEALHAAAASCIEQALDDVEADRGDRRASSAAARDFLYLGRGINFPIALEGALKLKEISYIHAEGYPAGEMKHGPIALIDEKMPVVVLAPHDSRLREDALQIQEVKARDGS